MIDPSGILGILITGGIAFWQNQKAKRAEAELRDVLNTLPAQIARALETIVKAGNHSLQPAPKGIAGVGLPANVQYLDVDNDGQNEMLVEYPAGAHGSQMKIFKWQLGEFNEIGALGVGTPVGFEVGDFDNDGKNEIKTEETDWSAGLPYVTAPRLVLLYRWDGSEFKEVSRTKSEALP